MMELSSVAWVEEKKICSLTKYEVVMDVIYDPDKQKGRFTVTVENKGCAELLAEAISFYFLWKNIPEENRELRESNAALQNAYEAAYDGMIEAQRE